MSPRRAKQPAVEREEYERLGDALRPVRPLHGPPNLPDVGVKLEGRRPMPALTVLAVLAGDADKALAGRLAGRARARDLVEAAVQPRIVTVEQYSDAATAERGSSFFKIASRT